MKKREGLTMTRLRKRSRILPIHRFRGELFIVGKEHNNKSAGKATGIDRVDAKQVVSWAAASGIDLAEISYVNTHRPDLGDHIHFWDVELWRTSDVKYLDIAA